MESASKKRSAAEITPARTENEKANGADALDEPSKKAKKTTGNTSGDTEHILHLNKLCCYPKTSYLPYMYSFREMLFEDFLKDPSKPNKTLELAIMTTYGFGKELLEPLLSSDIKLFLVNSFDNKNPIENNYMKHANCTLIHPPSGSNLMGSFHPKLWLLKFPKTLRIVIGTGNLTLGDWTIWSNAVWIKDFPLKDKSKSETTMEQDSASKKFDFDKDFKITLEDFLNSLVPADKNYQTVFGINLNDYEIKGIDVVLIPSVNGRHKEENFQKYGLQRISTILQGFTQDSAEKWKKKDLVVTYQTTSVGNLDEKYLQEFLASVLPHYANVQDFKEQKGKKNEKKKSKSVEMISEPAPQDERGPASKRVRMIYPDKIYALNALAGPDWAYLLKLEKDYYTNPAFPKEILHHYEASDNFFYNNGVLAHLKAMIITERNNVIDDDTIIYFGSHNLTQGAWGRYEKDFTQLSINNSELGVLLPPMPGSAAKKKALIDSLPFKFPPSKYEESDEPWFKDENYMKLASAATNNTKEKNEAKTA